MGPSAPPSHFRFQTSDFKLSSLGEIARRFFNRALFGLFPRCAVSTRESRARIDVRNRAVIHVAELVGLDRHRPARQLLLAPCVVFWFHESFSRFVPADPERVALHHI